MSAIFVSLFYTYIYFLYYQFFHWWIFLAHVVSVSSTAALARRKSADLSDGIDVLILIVFLYLLLSLSIQLVVYMHLCICRGKVHVSKVSHVPAGFILPQYNMIILNGLVTWVRRIYGLFPLPETAFATHSWGTFAYHSRDRDIALFTDNCNSSDVRYNKPF